MNSEFESTLKSKTLETFSNEEHDGRTGRFRPKTALKRDRGPIVLHRKSSLTFPLALISAHFLMNIDTYKVRQD